MVVSFHFGCTDARENLSIGQSGRQLRGLTSSLCLLILHKASVFYSSFFTLATQSFHRSSILGARGQSARFHDTLRLEYACFWVHDYPLTWVAGSGDVSHLSRRAVSLNFSVRPLGHVGKHTRSPKACLFGRRQKARSGHRQICRSRGPQPVAMRAVRWGFKLAAIDGDAPVTRSISPQSSTKHAHTSRSARPLSLRKSAIVL